MKKLVLFAFTACYAMQMSAQAVKTTETKGPGYDYITYEATSQGAGRLSEEFSAGEIKCNRIILHGELNGTDIVYLRKNLTLNQPSQGSANPFEYRMCYDFGDVDFVAGGETMKYNSYTIEAKEDGVVPEYAFAGIGKSGGIPAGSMVIFPDRAKKIGRGACIEGEGFASAVIGSETEEIDNGAFYGCMNIRAIFIAKDNKLKKIVNGFLNTGSNYTTLNLPAALQTLDSSTFSTTSGNLKTLYVHSSALDIKDAAIANIKFQNVYFYGAEAPGFGGGNALKFADGANIHVPVGAKDAYVNSLNGGAQVYGNTQFGTASGKKDAADVVKETGMMIPSVAGEAWGTWSDAVARTLPNGVKAYSVSGVSSDVATLSEITGAIPATGSLLTAEVESVSDPTIYGGKELTIIIGMDTDTRASNGSVPAQSYVQVLNEAATKALKASVHETNNAFYFDAPETTATAVITGTNYLVGTGAAEKTVVASADDMMNFVFGEYNVNGDVCAGFQNVAATVPAHSAYLAVPSSMSVEAGSVVILKDVTTGINATSAATTDNSWYSIQGVCVAQPAKGVFIHNGKKVVVK